MEVSNIGLRLFAGYGEGPHYDAASDQLLFVNIPNAAAGDHGCLFRRKYGDRSMETETLDLGLDYTTFVIPTKSGSLITSQCKDIVELEWPSGGEASPLSVVHSVDEGKKTRLNDAKCDPRGRLLAGTMSFVNSYGVPDKTEIASLYGLDADRKLHVFDTKLTLSNGIAFSLDEKRLFFIDSILNKVFVYDYDPDNFTAANRRVLFDFGAHHQLKGSNGDGCCIDRDHRLWIACYEGHRIICVDSTTGQMTSEVKIPTTSPTSCCFAGPSLNELVVTSSKIGTLDSDREAGSLFRVVNTGATGYGGVRFEG